MLYVICKNNVTKDNLNNFLKYSINHANQSKNTDKGCLRFDITKYDCDKQEILFIELWENKELLNIHTNRCKTSIDCINLSKYRLSKELNIYEI